MPRIQRIRSKTHVYHVMVSGIGKKNIFLDDEDKVFFIERLKNKQENESWDIYAYCLMNNHFHLIVNEKDDDISRIMKSINAGYANYFNKKYNRSGRVFLDRFRSEPIEMDNYLRDAIRYIHRNPVRGGLVTRIEDYPWTSYHEYVACLNDRNQEQYKINQLVVCEIRPVLTLFGEGPEAFLQFETYMSIDGDAEFIEYKNKESNKIFKEFIESNRELYNAYISNTKDKAFRNELLVQIKAKTSLSVRQIGELLGVSKDIVQRAK